MYIHPMCVVSGLNMLQELNFPDLLPRTSCPPMSGHEVLTQRPTIKRPLLNPLKTNERQCSTPFTEKPAQYPAPDLVIGEALGNITGS